MQKLDEVALVKMIPVAALQSLDQEQTLDTEAIYLYKAILVQTIDDFNTLILIRSLERRVQPRI